MLQALQYTYLRTLVLYIIIVYYNYTIVTRHAAGFTVYILTLVLYIIIIIVVYETRSSAVAKF